MLAKTSEAGFRREESDLGLGPRDIGTNPRDFLAEELLATVESGQSGGEGLFLSYLLQLLTSGKKFGLIALSSRSNAQWWLAYELAGITDEQGDVMRPAQQTVPAVRWILIL